MTHNYRIAFTPSCNKDIHAIAIIGTYSTHEAAKEALTEFLAPYLGDKTLDDYFVTPDYDGDLDDDPMIADAQEFKIPTMTEADYANLLAYDFIHLSCDMGRLAFWIFKTPTTVTYGALRKYLQSMLT